MFTNILIAVAILLLVLVVVVATRPAHFSVTRSARIPAAPAELFRHVNDLHLWQEWSPWAKLDPHSRISWDGPVAGVGAGFAWAGNSKVGEGRMTITESKPDERIVFKLEFSKPMKATNITEFTFTPDGSGTKVNWTMNGNNGFMGKLFGMIVNCDKMIGGQFEQGLDNLKSVVTASATP